MVQIQAGRKYITFERMTTADHHGRSDRSLDA